MFYGHFSYELAIGETTKGEKIASSVKVQPRACWVKSRDIHVRIDSFHPRFTRLTSISHPLLAPLLISRTGKCEFQLLKGRPTADFEAAIPTHGGAARLIDVNGHYVIVFHFVIFVG
jgi:hypothetical protein